MAKYKLINDTTHKIWYTNNEKEKNQLLQRGFHIQNITASKNNTPTTKKRKAAVRNGKDKNRAEGDI